MAIAPKLFKKMTQLISGSMTIGSYDVRLAVTEQEVQAAQKLRYEVLFKESGGRINEDMLNAGREEDEWDAVAYHVIVLNKEEQVVGTMRLVSNDNLHENQTFYTETNFELTRLRKHYPNILELSRACVSPNGRGGAILMLIWKFTMRFIEKNGYDVMLGCASFHGTDHLKHAEILSYLYDNHLAETALMPHPISTLNSISITDFKLPVEKGKRRGKVPTMLRGYLKIGARISEHVVIDPVFNTTFVVIYVDAQQMFDSNHVLVNKSVD